MSCFRELPDSHICVKECEGAGLKQSLLDYAISRSALNNHVRPFYWQCDTIYQWLLAIWGAHYKQNISFLMWTTPFCYTLFLNAYVMMKSFVFCKSSTQNKCPLMAFSSNVESTSRRKPWLWFDPAAHFFYTFTSNCNLQRDTTTYHNHTETNTPLRFHPAVRATRCRHCGGFLWQTGLSHVSSHPAVLTHVNCHFCLFFLPLNLCWVFPYCKEKPSDKLVRGNEKTVPYVWGEVGGCEQKLGSKRYKLVTGDSSDFWHPQTESRWGDVSGSKCWSEGQEKVTAESFYLIQIL